LWGGWQPLPTRKQCRCWDSKRRRSYRLLLFSQSAFQKTKPLFLWWRLGLPKEWQFF